jgi:hypothetical protein
MFEEALSRAQQLDDYLAKEGKVVGPLHGLPISVKVSSAVQQLLSVVMTSFFLFLFYYNDFGIPTYLPINIGYL